MAVLPRGRGARPAPEKNAPKAAPAPKQEPKSLTSDSTYNKKEAPELKGASEQDGFGSMTSGRHHGAVMALADAVGHHGATLTEGGMSSSHREGMNQLDKTYNHLSAHAKSHKVAKYSEAAGHLKEASKALNKAVTQFGGTRGTIRNAYGETLQGRDIEATTNHLVNHYAQAHGAKFKSVKEPEKYNLPTRREEQRLEQKKAAQKYMQPRGKAPVTKSEVVHFTGGDRKVKGDN